MVDKILGWDRELFLWLNFNGSECWDNFFWLVTGKLIWIPLYLLILWLIYRKVGLRNSIVAVLFLVLAVVISDHICNFFKYNFYKLRPTHTPELEGLIELVKGYKGRITGTVSAHVAVSTSIVVFSAQIIRTKWYTIPMISWVLLIAYSRIYVNAHFPLDLLWGAITGVGVGLVLTWLYRKTIVWLDKRAQKKQGKTEPKQ